MGNDGNLSIRHYLFRFQCALYFGNLIRESIYLVVKKVDSILKSLDSILKPIDSILKPLLKLLDSTLDPLKPRDIIIS